MRIEAGWDGARSAQPAAEAPSPNESCASIYTAARGAMQAGGKLPTHAERARQAATPAPRREILQTRGFPII
jgi:hypothetical protein